MKTKSLITKCILILQGLFITVIITTAQPAKQWDKDFGGNNDDVLQHSCLQQTSDGGYLMGGYSNTDINGDKTQATKGGYDYWIIKTNASGVKQWDKDFGGSGDDFLFSFQQTSDGGYILGGRSLSGISGDKTQDSRGGNDYWIIKTDANGNKQWDARFGGPGDDEFRSVAQTTDGGYILGGFSYSGIGGDKTEASQGNADYWIVKTDANGNKLWDKRFGGSDFDGLAVIKQTKEGGYILGGYSNSGSGGDKTQPSQGDADYWIIKIKADGTKQWDKRFGGNESDVLNDVKQTPDKGYILGGNSFSGISGDKTQDSRGSSDMWMIKTDDKGIKQWDARFGGSSDESAYSVKRTNDGGYIIAGNSSSGIGGDKTQESQGGEDFWIVKTCANGIKQWDARYGGAGTDALFAFDNTSGDGFIAGGESVSEISGDKTAASKGGADFWVVKIAAYSSYPVLYLDADHDGYGSGNPIDSVTLCSGSGTYVNNNLDCDDNNANVHPGATEIINGIDDNCNGLIDTAEIFCHACGNPAFSSNNGFSVGAGPSWLATGDFNEDGKADIVVSNQLDNNVSVVLGDGTGNFNSAAFFGVSALPLSVAVGDFNHDNHIDIVTANLTGGPVNGSCSILLGNGTGGFAPESRLNTMGISPRSVVVGDWNGDNNLDIAVLNQVSNTLGIMLGNGDGTFQPVILSAVGERPVYVGSADFNNDGKPDLAVSNRFDNNISILLGDGTGSFALHNNISIASLGSEPFISVTGDFNHDGNIDLAVKLNVGACVAILLGDGTGFFTLQPFSLAAGANFNALSVADFNRDGNLDLATDNVTDNSTVGVISLYLGDGSGLFPTLVTDTVSIGFGLLFPADFNMDGKLDLTSTGVVYINNCTAPDSDGDGVSDICDACPNDPNKILPGVFYADADHDGFGNPADSILSCAQPAGYVTNNTDCNDNNPNIHPGATEICDGIDNNCNGVIDENIPKAKITPLGSLDICTTGSVALRANKGTGLIYQWVKGKNNIAGATARTYTATSKGNYKVIVTDTITGCTGTSKKVTITTSCLTASLNEGDLKADAGELSLSPNPSSGEIIVKYNSINAVQIQLNVLGITGNSVFNTRESTIKGSNTYHLNLSHLAAGIYYLEMINDEEKKRIKFVVEK